jgi:hypothetical protein
MNLAFLSCFDRRLRLALGAVISPRAEALAALPRFRNRDLRHDPIQDGDKVLLRWTRDAETGRLVAQNRARRSQRYRSRFVWPDRRSA